MLGIALSLFKNRIHAEIVWLFVNIEGFHSPAMQMVLCVLEGYSVE